MFLKNFRLVDLTHSLSAKAPTWDNSLGFELQIRPDNDYISMHTSTGTHIDAPSHFGDPYPTIDNLSLQQLIAPAIVIDVSAKATADYQISVQDLLDNEASYGAIASRTLIVGYTGWSNRWPDRKAYRNIDTNNDVLFPTFSLDAIDYLLKKDIVGIAIDTFAPERITATTDYPLHKHLFAANKYIIENLANASLLPPRGAYIIALPLKVEGAGEAPARIIGLIP
jgi:kynurenine formamidase